LKKTSCIGTPLSWENPGRGEEGEVKKDKRQKYKRTVKDRFSVNKITE
jgi:hypothetical protein